MRGMTRLAWPFALLGVACSGAELLPDAGAGLLETQVLNTASVRSLRALAELGTARLGSNPTPTAVTATAAEPEPASAEPEPASDPGPAAPPAAPDVHWLGALAREVVVFAEPDAGSRRLGYLRTGARVRRSAEPVSRRGCRGGWYRVAPEGFVCNSSRATLDLEHPVLQLALATPSRDDGLPYAYGRSRSPAPRIYSRVTGSLGGPIDLGAWQGVALQPVPELLLAPSAAEVASVESVPKSAFAFVSFVEAGGGAYGVTTDLSLVPLRGVTPIVPSRLHGLALDDATTLPVAFVLRATTFAYRGDPATGLSLDRQLERREAVPLGARRLRRAGVTWLETRDGFWLREDAVRVVPRRDVPSRSGKWIDVSLSAQTLVAYEGTKPVFVTLVSTGEGGTGDPTTTDATVQGQFRIHTKHVTATMDSDEIGDTYDLRDVPYVQYFTQGYALHAAYWHDGFGAARSHGCVNLSPSDARYLFHWSDPPVPQGWHTALSAQHGTLIDIHP